MEGEIKSKQKFIYELIPTQNYKNIQESFKEELLKLSKANKIILIYPIPEVGWNPNKKIYLQWINNKNKTFEIKPITTSYDVNKERTKASFKLLDDIKNENIYRIYPHEVFCNTQFKDKFITHDKKTSFYYDDDHLSIKGSEIINNLMFNKIEN